jgi:2-polyprenyl-6-methoxyphenol hydroxylase-like FAD-dependent oxidoreductase
MAASLKSLTIIGGGLAGLTLGIGLRQRGVPVTIWEAGHYPRHRVCGEFISGRGVGALQRLGLFDDFVQQGAIAARNAVLCSEHRTFSTHALPDPAWSLSRFILDRRLAEQFQQLGGDLHCGSRWTGEPGDEGIILASGRRAPASGDGPGWFGLKAHASHVALAADLELHFTSHGYVGLCRLGGDRVNVCGLFRQRPTDHARPQHRQEWLTGTQGSLLHTRLARARWDEGSQCAVAALPLEPRDDETHVGCCVGDAWTMTPPFTGNGMSMAFESAELAIAPLTAYALGEQSWNATRTFIRRKCQATFAARLRHARRLQRALQHTPLRKTLLPVVAGVECLWRLCFRLTR